MRGFGVAFRVHRGCSNVGPNRRSMLSRISRDDAWRHAPIRSRNENGSQRRYLRMHASIRESTASSLSPMVTRATPCPAPSTAFKNASITISTVAVESHGLPAVSDLQNIAHATGGKYYSVKSGRALPRIFQREARRVSKPLVFEPPGGAVPECHRLPARMLDGIDRVLPQHLSGFVMTQTKDSSAGPGVDSITETRWPTRECDDPCRVDLRSSDVPPC